MNQLSVAAALKPLEEALAADGYRLIAESVREDRLVLRIVAMTGACEDCLIPRMLFVQMVADALKTHDASLGGMAIDVVYPTDGETVPDPS